MNSGFPWLVLSVACLAGAAWASPRLESGLPGLEVVRLEASHAMEDLAFLGLGMRRQAADLHFIRLLQYYGSPEEAEEGHADLEHHGHPHGGDYGGGVYAEIYPRALRFLELDPYFRYGALYAAGALAFNLNRPEQAVELLRQALARDPRAWRYHLYIAAIAYRKEQEFGKLVAVLEPALGDPDCPAMLKVILGGIYVKLGNREKAVALYRDIGENSRDPEYRTLARQRLEKLLSSP